MKLSGKQFAAARELLGLSQNDLATLVGLTRRTIGKFETGAAELKGSTLSLIRAELERRGIEFTNGDCRPSEGDGIGVRLNFGKAAAFARVVAPGGKEADR